MARPSERTELTFLISQRVPNGSPGWCTLTLASTRIEPSSILASEAPTATRIARSSVTYWRACSAVRMSGRLTISTSGTPARLKSISEESLPWMRPPAAADVGGLAGVLLEVGPLDADPVAVGQVEPAVDVERLVVLADLVRLGHVGIEVVLAVERARLDACS